VAENRRGFQGWVVGQMIRRPVPFSRADARFKTFAANIFVSPFFHIQNSFARNGAWS